jgi:hypothetical protein
VDGLAVSKKAFHDQEGRLDLGAHGRLAPLDLFLQWMISSNVLRNSSHFVVRSRRCAAVAGLDSGGERAAAIHSLIGTARLKGLDPEAFLRQAIGCIAEHPVNRVAELLPWNLAFAPAADSDSPA